MGNTRTEAYRRTSGKFYPGGPDDDVSASERRLARLIELNTAYEAASASDKLAERLPALRGVGPETAFAFLGLCLGLIPPSAFFARLLLEKGDAALIVIGSLVTLFASLTGFFTGKLVGRIVNELERFSWTMMLLALPFLGATWGIVAGGAGGAFAFIFGAIPGAVIGAAAGTVGLPVFAALHRWLRTGEEIERNLLIPAAVGVSSAIGAAFTGYPGW